MIYQTPLMHDQIKIAPHQYGELKFTLDASIVVVIITSLVAVALCIVILASVVALLDVIIDCTVVVDIDVSLLPTNGVTNATNATLFK